jgi:hypothetical protein
MDKYEAVVELYHTFDGLDAGHAKVCPDAGRRVTFDNITSFIDDQCHPARRGLCDHDLIFDADLPLGKAEASPDVQHRKNTAFYSDRAEHDIGRARERRHLDCANDTIDGGKLESVALPVQFKDDEVDQSAPLSSYQGMVPPRWVTYKLFVVELVPPRCIVPASRRCGTLTA